MTLYEILKSKNIDFDAIGFGQHDTDVSYYCTPRDARILGWAGVDGIHYCTIPEFGEMIFAVSPMNFGDCVHPIARSFEDLLRLLLYCVDMAALEQCFAWDEEQFKAFLIDCPATEKQQAVLDAIRKETGLEPMEDAFRYVKELQAGFDLSKIPYTEDYYDPDMNAAAPQKPAEWKVTFDGNYWGNYGDAGLEIPIGKHFRWDKENWYVPSVYLCAEGIVADYCMEADTALVKAYIDKWDLLHEADHSYTWEQQEQMRQENPLHINFCSCITINGHVLRQNQGCGASWIPESLLPSDTREKAEIYAILEHYGLDKDRAWFFCRNSYRWDENGEQELKSLSVHLERDKEHFTGRHFFTPDAGESILLTHPLTGKTYTLTVHEAESQALSADMFPDDGWEHPTHFVEMQYSLEPDISAQGFLIQDCTQGDASRRNADASHGSFGHAAGVSIIGGADGPTVVFMCGRSDKLHAACSSLYFAPPEKVEWKPVFSEKTEPDLDVLLL